MNDKLIAILALTGLGAGAAWALWPRRQASAPAAPGHVTGGAGYPTPVRTTYRDRWGRIVVVNDTGLAGEESGAQDYNDVYYKMCRQRDGSYAPCVE